jgi:MscS family membrane protein
LRPTDGNAMKEVFLNNTVQEYIITGGIILLILLSHRFLSRYLANLFCRLFQRSWKDFDEQTFIRLVVRPISQFLLIFTTIVALYRLAFPKVINITIYKYTLSQILHTAATLLLIVVFIKLLLRLIDFLATVLERRAIASADHNDNQLILFFKDFFKVVVGIIGLLMMLHFGFSYNIGTLLTGLSIVGAAVALALRESLENLIASFVIFFDKPFTTGDLVKVQNITGNVERIGLRSTRIRTEQKTYVTVPNKQMVDSILDNLSLRSQRKNDLDLHLNLQTSSDKIEVAMIELRAYLAKIEDLLGFNVLLNDVNAQAIVLHIDFSTLPIDMNRFNAIKQDLNLFAIQTLEKLDIKIAGAMAPAPPPPAHS